MTHFAPAPTSSPTAFAIAFPERDEGGIDQDDERFAFTLDGARHVLRVHDYDRIFSIPGLYEALVYDRLECRSPQRVAALLAAVLDDAEVDPADQRVLDLGAGNGIVGAALRQLGVGTVVGLDLLPEARDAARRDHPGVYADYVVADLTDLGDEDRRRLEDAKLDALVTVAALGFGDIPPAAFAAAFDLVADGGWVAMTIKEDFLDERADQSGFSRLLRALIDEGILEVRATQRYRHRLSLAGEPIHYLAVAGRRTAAIPRSLVRDADRAPAIETRPTAGGTRSILLGGR